MTVHEVSRMAGISVRTLQYYDRIGLLKPAGRTAAGYRQYDESNLDTLRQILLFRELEVPLSEIRRILRDPAESRESVLREQIRLLNEKKQRLERLIAYADALTRRNDMDFSVFREKRGEYAARAEKQWGDTPEYREYKEKSRDVSPERELEQADEFMALFAEFGRMKAGDPDAPAVRLQVKKLQDTITANYYACSDEILCSLAEMYTAGGEFTENIDAAGGPGTAAFTAEAIRRYCGKQVR